MHLLVVHEETINVELPNVGKAPSCLYVQLAALHYGNGLHVLGGIVGNELAKEQGRPNLLIKHKSKDMTPDLRRELELMRFISARSAGRGGGGFWLACLCCAGGAFLLGLAPLPTPPAPFPRSSAPSSEPICPALRLLVVVMVG